MDLITTYLEQICNKKITQDGVWLLPEYILLANSFEIEWSLETNSLENYGEYQIDRWRETLRGVINNVIAEFNIVDRIEHGIIVNEGKNSFEFEGVYFTFMEMHMDKNRVSFIARDVKTKSR